MFLITTPFLLYLSMWPHQWSLTYFWKILTLAVDFFILRDKVFIFGICVPYYLSDGAINIEHVKLSMTFNQILKKKTLILTIICFPQEIEFLYLAYFFIMTRPYWWYHKFWTCDLDREFWPSFEHWPWLSYCTTFGVHIWHMCSLCPHINAHMVHNVN